MRSAFSSRPVILSLLHSLLAEEYALYLATRDASHAAVGCWRLVLEGQTRGIGTHLERLAWQLGCRGECALVGRTLPGNESPRSPVATLTGLRHLRRLHDGLIGQLHRFGARTSRLGDPALDELFGDLLSGHAQAASTLRSHASDSADASRPAAA